MKRRIIADLEWDTPTERDKFKNNIDARLANTRCYDRGESHGEDEEGNPVSRVDVRPEKETDADDLYEHIKNKMMKTPGVRGRITIHDCQHDEGPPFEECRIDREYEK